METYIALFRGINVGGAHSLPMRELTAILESLGCQAVKTYIQSGNVVFQSKEKSTAKLAEKISAEVFKRRGFAPLVMLLTVRQLEQAIENNPFPKAVTDPSKLAIGFLERMPKKPDMPGLDALRLKNERFSIVGECFYLHAPDGFGRSKLASRAEKLIGVPMTARNWRTVSKIWEMVSEL